MPKITLAPNGPLIVEKPPNLFGAVETDLAGNPKMALCRYRASAKKPFCEPNTAAVVRAALSEPAAVIVPLIIMRPDQERVLPAYLAWAINQPDAQRMLGSEAQGTSLRMIPKAALERMEDPLPDLETQHHIATVDALARREGGLLRELADRRAQATDIKAPVKVLRRVASCHEQRLRGGPARLNRDPSDTAPLSHPEKPVLDHTQGNRSKGCLDGRHGQDYPRSHRHHRV